MKFKIFISGFLQVYFIAINTIFLATSQYIGVFFIAFAISMIWCFNVSKVSVSKISDKIIYSLGASVGSLLGLLTTKFIL
jgi:hypothetical protein